MDVQKPIKRLTVKFVNYLNLTAEEKRAKKIKEQTSRKNTLTFSNKWVGLLPFVFRSMIKHK